MVKEEESSIIKRKRGSSIHDFVESVMKEILDLLKRNEPNVDFKGCYLRPSVFIGRWDWEIRIFVINHKKIGFIKYRRKELMMSLETTDIGEFGVVSITVPQKQYMFVSKWVANELEQRGESFHNPKYIGIRVKRDLKTPR